MRSRSALVSGWPTRDDTWISTSLPSVRAGSCRRPKGLRQAGATSALRRSICSRSCSMTERGLAANLIRAAGGRPEEALEKTEAALDALPRVEGDGAGQIYLAPETVRLFDSALDIAKKAGDSYVTAERLLLALALAKGTRAARILGDAGVSPQTLNAAINDLRKGRTADSASAESSYDALKKYARDLTEAARGGTVDPVIGRDEEIRRIMQVLSRRTKNNPVIIGEPGVGKTAIVEGPRPAHRQRRRARIAQGQAAAGSRSRGNGGRGQVPRRVRGASEGGVDRGQRGGGRGRDVHRRAPHAGGRRRGRRRDGCLQPAQARACQGGAALRGRNHARRIPQACGEGRGAGAALSARLRVGADRRGHGLHPARPQGEVRGPPRRRHHRQRHRRGGHALQPLHHRSLPARQGHRPGRRGGEQAQDGDRLQAGGAGRTRPAHHPAQDRAGSAEEGDRRALTRPA